VRDDLGDGVFGAAVGDQEHVQADDEVLDVVRLVVQTRSRRCCSSQSCSTCPSVTTSALGSGSVKKLPPWKVSLPVSP
jgi:hypothetical protein